MQIADFFKRLFCKKKDNNMSDKNTSSGQASAPKRKHKLEIQVYEADYEKADANNGQPQWRPVRSDPVLDGCRPNIIEVADKEEFIEMQKQYAMCDQRIKVIREIDPFDDEPPKSSSIPQNNQAIPVAASTLQPAAASASQQSLTPQAELPAPVQPTAAKPKPKPKIVTIGDIEVKYDGDKVYQKQWMKLTPSEASNFRVVNDANNKIVSLNGKHIEAKRWTLVEESASSGVDDAIENIIEG